MPDRSCVAQDEQFSTEDQNDDGVYFASLGRLGAAPELGVRSLEARPP
jgi:hypothetical protein